MDINQIEQKISEIEQECLFEIEDSKLFAKRIIREERKKSGAMNKKVRKASQLVACIALAIIVGGGGIYASELYKHFTFSTSNEIVTVNTTISDFTKEDARKYMIDSKNSYVEDESLAPLMEKTYTSLEAVEERMDMEVAVPQDLPNDLQRKEQVQLYYHEDEALGNTYYATLLYESTQNPRKGLEVIVSKVELGENVVSVTHRGGKYHDEYENAKGDTYNLLEAEGKIWAQTSIGNIEYLLVFEDFSEEEMEQIIDQVDLSGLK